MSDITIYIENADGPIQLNVMNEKTGLGRRVLGSKGSPNKKVIAKFSLTKKEALDLAREIAEVANED